MGFRNAVKQLLVGTAFEAPAKQLHYSLTRSKNSLYDLHTIAIMRRVLRPDSVAVDIGAHEGSMLRHMVRLAPQGRHVAVEPIPEKAALLRKRFPNCRVVEAAVGAAPGTAAFVEVVDQPVYSGLVRRRDLAADTRTTSYEVKIETLDRIVPAEVPVAFVKIDVEGGEYGVFAGGVETLRRCRPVVVFECGLGGADSYGTSPEALHDLVREQAMLRIYTMSGWRAMQPPLDRASFAERFHRGLDFYFVAAP